MVNQFSGQCDNPSWVRNTLGDDAMVAAIARVIARVSKATDDNETLKILTVFCLVGLLVSVIAARHGLDMSWAFF
jgi:multisubunit Na+/H+ antiporter MnhF subunit